jgi:precorrin-6A/cobalt-precorrin-6A reductase
MMTRILILGGTTEARQLAGKLAARPDLDVTLSLAGRTQEPVAQPVPVRTGGFGGAEGLAAWLEETGTQILIDATHPFAARISANAVEAARKAHIPIVALRRPQWTPIEGDRWTLVGSVSEAIAALGDAPRRVFVALGRQELAPLAHAPQHFYLIRSVDPIEPKLAVPHAQYILDRGPFAEATEGAMLSGHGIEAVIAKNSGGAATYGKIAAARALGIPVILVRRPNLPDVPAADSVDAALAMIDHLVASAKRGE